jgi:hypothetical protein
LQRKRRLMDIRCLCIAADFGSCRSCRKNRRTICSGISHPSRRRYVDYPFGQLPNACRTNRE